MHAAEKCWTILDRCVNQRDVRIRKLYTSPIIVKTLGCIVGYLVIALPPGFQCNEIFAFY